MAMKEFIKKHMLIIIFSTVGAAGGFIYWKFVGCLSGTCVIKSVWYLSTFYGALLGGILGSLTKDLIQSFKKQKNYE
jgi:hypothetical protein